MLLLNNFTLLTYNFSRQEPYFSEINISMIPREKLYRFPWSKTDNPGGWIEVTDICDLHCPGCYRHQLEGHRPVEAVKKDIDVLVRLTNCDSIAITGGEPLGYPDLAEGSKLYCLEKDQTHGLYQWSFTHH